MNKKLIGASILAVASTLTLTACGNTSNPVTAPSSSTSAADDAIRSIEPYGAERMDRAAARAALESGHPFLVGLPDGSAEACHSALLLPGDARPWILNVHFVRAAGHALTEDRLLTYGCGGGESVPPVAAPTPALDTAMDEAAADRAKAQGRPFIYAIPSSGVTACNTGVRTPDGQAWFLNRSGEASPAGDALSDVQNLYGCRIDPSR